MQLLSNFASSELDFPKFKFRKSKIREIAKFENFSCKMDTHTSSKDASGESPSRSYWGCIDLLQPQVVRWREQEERVAVGWHEEGERVVVSWLEGV